MAPTTTLGLYALGLIGSGAKAAQSVRPFDNIIVEVGDGAMGEMHTWTTESVHCYNSRADEVCG